jgi:hypothetical protein
MNLYEAQWLAYALPYRRFAAVLTDCDARLGADMDRYAFIVSDLHRLLVAGLPAHCERFWTLPPDAIADFLPSAGARVLITSRFSDWSELAAEVALDVLPLEKAVAFLQSRTGRSDAEGEKTLAEALGRLPLALDHAAAYCKRTQMQFAEYAKKAASLIDIAPRGVGYLRSVGATFDLAISEAVAQCPSAEAPSAHPSAPR